MVPMLSSLSPLQKKLKEHRKKETNRQKVGIRETHNDMAKQGEAWHAKMNTQHKCKIDVYRNYNIYNFKARTCRQFGSMLAVE